MRINKSLANKLLCIIIIALFAFLTMPNSQLMAQTTDVADSIERVHAYYKQQSVMDEWEALAARWSGLSPAAELGFSEPVIPSDYARAILGSIATDKDAVHINGLITALQAMQMEEGCFSPAGELSPTLNQTVWPLIALDLAAVNGYNTTFDREAAVDYIISRQSPEGGFDESAWGVDVDSTAHALISLAPYQDHYPQAAPAIEQALVFLKSQQFAGAGFGGWGAINPDSTAAVIEALTALKINPSAPEWMAGDKTMVDALLEFQSDQGWFVYSTAVSEWNDPTQPNLVSTRNALLALGDLAGGSSKYQSIMPVIGSSQDDDDSDPGNGNVSSTVGRAFISIVGDLHTGTIIPRQAWVWTAGTPTVMDALLGVLQQNQHWLQANNVQLEQGQPLDVNDELPDWAAGSVHYMLNSGFMAPLSGSFAGDQLLSREDAAVLIYQALFAMEQV